MEGKETPAHISLSPCPITDYLPFAMAIGTCLKFGKWLCHRTLNSVAGNKSMSAVLVAIAIPVFTSQLEKSRDAVTVSNLRAAYAEAATEVLTSNTLTVTKQVVCKGTDTTDLSGLDAELPFTVNSSDYANLNNRTATVVFTWTANSDAAPTITVS